MIVSMKQPTSFQDVTGRREFLGALTLGVLAMAERGQAADEQTIPFTDGRPFNPQAPNLPWDQLAAITPEEQFFFVKHYDYPDVALASWKLDIGGLVAKPQSLTLDAIRSRPKKDYTVLLECSGNPAAGGLVGNAKWTGTSLGALLKDCGIKSEGTDIVFFAADSGTEKLGTAEYKMNFARDLPLADAMHDDVILAYEANGKPLMKNHGAPLRLVVPGWYGVAWVKYITRIEVYDRPYQNRFMARDYVTLRGEKHGEDTIWRETLVGRMNVKSVPARVMKSAAGSLRVEGAAWSDGTPLKSVEVKIDEGPWQPAKLESNGGNNHTWTFWSYDWTGAQPGDHTVTSRATDAKGAAQPAPDDPFVTLKKTRWENYQQAVRKIKI
jgi:DMSO/TMAO reductase YedYZ molybdopterin-dependent catalytic subunit